MPRDPAESRRKFLEDTKFLERAAEFPQGRALKVFTSNMIEALAEFGTAELNAVSAERRDALGIQVERARVERAEIDKHNEKGLRWLSHAQNSLPQFDQELGGFPQQSNFEQLLQTYHTDLKDALVDTDVKPGDLKKIDKIVEECIAEVSASRSARCSFLLGEEDKRLRGTEEEP
jgi:hypothetical protein